MLKKIVYFFLIFSTISYAQLSNKHWIPPLHSRSGSVIQEHYLYLSTPETTPIQVTVTDGSGTPIPGSPFTISQGNPHSELIGLTQPSVMMLNQSDLNIVKTNKGLILESTGEFYASFRLLAQNHAEILVCKGRDGAGTAFRLGSLPMIEPGGIRNFVSSFMATEDNTVVTLSDYDTGVVFASGSGNILEDTQTFNLNAGESVTVSGYTDFSPNLSGFVGALLTSTKPIVVNTGNATGGMLSASDGQDLNLDQIVPIDIVGDEYIVVKGNGSDNTERPLVIATENNTQVFINGSTTAITTLNAGDYFLIPTSYYTGTANQNMYISSDKDIYLYQIIAGATSDATSGLNFIPPLSCFWQKSVDMIPSFNSIGFSTFPNSEIIVVTETGSTVTINNSPTTATPQTVTGNSNWVTYRISGLSGNVKIESTGALAAGVFGSSGFAGYGGYYSGFGSLPRNTVISICSNETVNLFDAITGNPEPNGDWTVPSGAPLLSGDDFIGTVNTSGDYIYTFSKVCDNSNLRIPVTVSVNVQQAPFAGTNKILSICKNDPSVDLFTILDTGVTTGGTWSPALASGTSVFNPALDTSGIYTYTIPTSGVCQGVSASVTVTNNSVPLISPISDFKECDNNNDGNDDNGFVVFNLTTKNNEVLNSQTGIAVTYHTDINDAILGRNAITSIYTDNRVIYVRLTNIVTSCFSTTSFNLVVNRRPTVVSEVPLKQCDTDTDARTDFNLTEANIQISNDPTYTFSYHNSLLGAETNTDLVANEIVYNALNGSVVWARIVNSDGCYRTAKVNLIVSATTIPQTFRYTIDDVCDDYISSTDPDGDGIGYFDLTEIEPILTRQFPPGQSYTFSYYLNEADATAEQYAITNVTNFRNTIANGQPIWVRIESNLYECAGLGPFLNLAVNPLPDFDLGQNFILCLDPVTGIGSKIIDATPTTPGNYSYIWSPANPLGNSPLYDITAAGTYTVVVTNTSTGCSNTDSITASFSSAPVSVYATLLTPPFSPGYASIEATAVGGFGVYEYSLDGIEWQMNPIFSGLENGNYTIYVRDIQGCGILQTQSIQTLTYNNYFTPNNDGFNDTWNISLPLLYKGSISIFDRYGKLLKQISPYGEGWDGTYNGYPMPSSDYWFKLEYTENNQKKEFKSHFSLKR